MLFSIGCISFQQQKFFNNLTDHKEEKCKRHYVVLKKLKRARNKWNEDEMNWLDKGLCQKNGTKANINHDDEAMLEYYQLSIKLKTRLPLEPRLLDFYHTLEGQN